MTLSLHLSRVLEASPIWRASGPTLGEVIHILYTEKPAPFSVRARGISDGEQVGNEEFKGSSEEDILIYGDGITFSHQDFQAAPEVLVEYLIHNFFGKSGAHQAMQAQSVAFDKLPILINSLVDKGVHVQRNRRGRNI